jgi:glycogen synthase
VVFNGVDLSEQPGSDLQLPERFVLAAGRLVKNKGFDILIKAFGVLADTFPHVHLIIAGEGEEHRQLAELIEASGLSSRVTLFGRADRSAIASLFQHCELFVMPSPVEPFGIVCLEGLRAGKPVIATTGGGPREFLREGIDSFLVEPYSSDGLAGAMSKLLGDAQLRQKMGSAAAESARRFDWREIGRQYLEIYARLVTAYGR